MQRDLSLFMVYYSLEGEYQSALNKARVLTGPLYGQIKTLQETETLPNKIIDIMHQISWINRRHGVYRALYRQRRILQILKQEGGL